MSTMTNKPGVSNLPTPAQPAPEGLLWEGHPSQWTNFWPFVLCLLVIPIPWGIYRWLATKCTTYSLSNQRLRLRTGILSRHIDDLELYRVKDSAISQPFLHRMVGLGHIDLVTSDASTPRLRLRSVAQPIEVHDMLRGQVERVRRERGVRELDVNAEPDSPIR